MPLTFSTADQPRLLSHAATLTESEGFMPDATALGVKTDGELGMIAVFQNITASGADLHFGAIASQHVTRRALQGIGLYAFNVLGVSKITAHIAGWNVPAQVMALKTGFFIAGVITRGSLDGSDNIVMVLKKDAYRWLPHTQPQPIETAA